MNITKATMKDTSEIKRIMDAGFVSVQDKTWYVTDDVEFLERHIETEGYISLLETEKYGGLKRKIMYKTL